MRKKGEKNPISSEATYEVGFGRPPKRTQWKGGESGNKNGRPKAKPNIRHEIEKAFLATTTVKTESGVKQVSFIQMLVMKCTAETGKGDMRAAKILVELLGKISAASPPANNDNDEDRSDDNEVLKAYRDDLVGRGDRDGK
jgi:hypothetical protein